MDTNTSEGQIADPASEATAQVMDDSNGQTDWKDRFEDLNARYDLLNDTVAELRDAVVQSQVPRQAAQYEDDDYDDDEPLTGSRVKKIVSSSISKAVAQSNQQSQRQTWDQKAKEDFPLNDPKFLREFKKEWNSMVVDGGLDANHHKAIYTVAKTVAKGWGGSTKKEANHDTVLPTSRASEPVGTARKATIADNDSRVKFYSMRGNKTKEQIEAFKAKLASEDARKRSKR